jgi:type IV pilus assembly protein PilY1
MLNTRTLKAGLLGAALFALPSVASAQGFLTSNNGLVSIGVNPEGFLDINPASVPGAPSTQGSAGFLGIAYNFSGQGGRTGWQDALSPGCFCEDLGVAGNGVGSAVGGNSGNIGVTLVSDAFVPNVSHTSNITAAAGLSVMQVVTKSFETATGALFQAEVTIANNTGATVTGVEYARAMDWDVPPTEFSEYVEHAGIAFTGNLLRATNNGFASANPITAIADGGIGAVPNTNGDQNGINDHGSLFLFGFGDLDDGESTTFKIYYGAGANRGDALALIGGVNAELYSFGFSSGCTGSRVGSRCDDQPVYVFAFGDVGLPPIGVPAPAALGLFGLGLLGLGLARRRLA